MKKDTITFREIIDKMWECYESKKIINFIAEHFEKFKKMCFYDFQTKEGCKSWTEGGFTYPFSTIKLYKFFIDNEYTFANTFCKWLRENDYEIKSESEIKERINKIEKELEELKEELNY